MKKKSCRLISALLSAVMAFSAVSFSTLKSSVDLIGYADDGTEVALSPGEYVAPLYVNSEAGTIDSFSSYNKFYGQAVLTIDEDYSQYLTVGVQNYSLYDAFVALNQEYTDEYASKYSNYYVPEKLLDERDLTSEDSFRENFSDYIIKTTDENADYYDYTTDDASNIRYDETTDSAYITFEINDYTEPVWVLWWTNIRIQTGFESAITFHNAAYMWLGLDSLYSVDDIDAAIEDGTANVGLRQATQLSSATAMNYKSSATIVLSYIDTENSRAYKNSEDEYQIKLYLNHYDGFKSGSYLTPTNLQILVGKDQSKYAGTGSGEYDRWVTDNKPGSIPQDTTSIFEDLEIYTDETGTYVLISYTKNELLFGKYFWFNTQKTSTSSMTSLFCSPCVMLDEPVKQITITSEDEKYDFIKVVTWTSNLPEGTTLEVIENDAEHDYGYTSSIYSEANWYTIYFNYNGERIEAETNPTIYFTLPEDYTESNSYLEQRLSDGTRSSYSDVEDFENHTWTYLYIGTSGNTFAICKLADAIDPQQLSDGIYSVEIFLQKTSEADGTPSMSNDCFESAAYIVKDGDSITLWFKGKAMYSVLYGDAYIGDIHCAGYNENTSYTSYLINEDGSLVNNATYDAITEYACVTGGIIELESDCWVEDRTAYRMTVASPIMAALSGTEYEEATDSELGVLLRFVGATKLSDEDIGYLDYEDYIKSQGYGYDKSALRREIDLAGTYEEDLYTTASWAALQETLELAQTVYEASYTSLITASDAYEEQIANIEAALAALVVDDSAVGDKTELEALVAKAKAIDSDSYTTSSYNALSQAIAAAEKVLAKDAVKQSKLDEQVEALQAAIDALEEKQTTLDKDNLADGTYTLYAEMIKTDRESYSMSNNAINHTVQLDVIDGEYYITVQFKGLSIYNLYGYLSYLGYYDEGYAYNEYGVPEGDVIDATVLSYYDVVDQYNADGGLYPQLLQFKLVDKASADYIPLQVFVPIMEAIAEGNGTQDVLMVLDWTTLVSSSTGLEVEDPEEQSPAFDYTDEATGIVIHADEGVLPEDVYAVVTQITTGDDYDNAAAVLADVGSAFNLYDIELYDSDGNAVTPNGKIQISIPVPDGYTNPLVYRITDGKKTLVTGTVSDGMYTFYAMEAGVYAIVDAAAETTGSEESADAVSSSDSSGETSSASSSAAGSSSSSSDSTENPATGAATTAAAFAALAIALLVTAKKGKEK